MSEWFIESTRRAARERAVRMVAEIRGQHDWSGQRSMRSYPSAVLAARRRCVKKWVRQAQVDAGARPGTTTEDPLELKRLRRTRYEGRTRF